MVASDSLYPLTQLRNGWLLLKMLYRTGMRHQESLRKESSSQPCNTCRDGNTFSVLLAAINLTNRQTGFKFNQSTNWELLLLLEPRTSYESWDWPFSELSDITFAGTPYRPFSIYFTKTICNHKQWNKLGSLLDLLTERLSSMQRSTWQAQITIKQGGILHFGKLRS